VKNDQRTDAETDEEYFVEQRIKDGNQADLVAQDHLPVGQEMGGLRHAGQEMAVPPLNQKMHS
jgi:hypothetical protein